MSDGVEQSYTDVLNLIRQQINKLVGNGIIYDREQALSDANLAFVKAYHNFDPEKGQFTTHVGFRVQMGLKTELRNRHLRKRPLTFSELDENGQDQIQRKMSKRNCQPRLIEKELPDWTEKLSLDSMEIVCLILDTPKDIFLFMKERGRDHPRTFRSCVKYYLRCLGWRRERIINAFEEIKRLMA